MWWKISGSVLLLAVIIGLVFNVIQIRNLKTTQIETNIRSTQTNQFLLSTINWSTQRQKILLFMRDQIVQEWTRLNITPINYDKAYQKAEAIMKECERYPNLKPFLLLAVCKRESSYLDSTKDSSNTSRVITSTRGARGAWQFVPSTARLLCEALGISYSDKIYTDISTSTRMAAKYFDILWASYENDTLSIADYNGGPSQAWYYAHDRSRVSPETSAFIPGVLGYYDEFNKDFVLYRVDKTIGNTR